MFTGIIETIGTITEIQSEGTNKHFYIASNLLHELKVDQSIAHNGVCLTVVAITPDRYQVTAIEETLNKTTLNKLVVGDKINLERCMPAHGRFDGHIVQGHVDGTAICKSIEQKEGSWEYEFECNDLQATKLIVNKGSICINGISLTVVNCEATVFKVAIIPYTYEFTNMHQLQVGDSVNIEYDIIGKYIAKMVHS